MGVNELAQVWRELAGEPKYPSSRTYDAGFENGQYSARSMCAFDLESEARTAWKPVSEPPTEEDGDAEGYVILLYPDGGIDLAFARYSNEWNTELQWARIRDVVLMPPGESG